MPVSLGSLDGVNQKTAAALRKFADALNRLEAVIEPLAKRIDVPMGVDSAARAAMRTTEQQIQAIGQRLRALEGDVDTTNAANSAVARTSIVGTPNSSPTDRLPLFDGSAIVAGVFAAHPEFIPTECQTAPGGTWDLMDAIVDALRAADPRFAYNGKRGNANDPSLDAIAYDYGAVPGGEGATTVYIIDVIAGHCGGNPRPSFNDVTVFAPGVWISRGRF